MRELTEPAARGAAVTSQASGDDWLMVPVAFFLGGEDAPFALFNRYHQIADLRMTRTVHISPGDVTAFHRYLRRRLPTMGDAFPAEVDARAWALHRALTHETAEVMQLLPTDPERPGLMHQVIEVARLAASWVPAQPAPYLAALVQGEQTASTHGVTTALFALALGIAKGSVEDIEALTAITIAGLFADAGKATLPDTILQKSGALSSEEWAAIRQHPEQSAALLMRAGVRTVATLRAVRWHHERWGGGGYPDGLTARAIPLEARIVGIADAFAALTVDRPFTTGVSGYDALAEMARSEGHFDPGLLRTFITTVGRALPVQERWNERRARTPAPSA